MRLGADSGAERREPGAKSSRNLAKSKNLDYQNKALTV